MPNWCENRFYIYGKDKALVMKFYMDMVVATSDHPNFIPIDNSWGTKWIGNLFLGAGFDPVEVENGPRINCRGCIYGVTLVGDSEGVELETDTAWGPNNESMQELVDKYPGLSMVYISEEPNCGVFVNSDTTGIRYKTRYRFQYTKNGDDYHEKYFESIQELSKYVASIISVPVDRVEFAIQTGILEKYKDTFQCQYGDDADFWLDEFADE